VIANRAHAELRRWEKRRIQFAVADRGRFGENSPDGHLGRNVVTTHEHHWPEGAIANVMRITLFAIRPI
jgi:hypothetical protein